MRLHDIAHARSGDKGDTSNIAVFVYDPADYPFLLRHLTAGRVAEHFRWQVRGGVTRYELPALHALNFVMTGALRGGVLRSLALDTHGKSLSSALLALELPDPD
ncbi:AtuA-related protein [Pararhodobacter sp.]|uniref:AtuA-related protein n=1 Tax=Pararhodobacter sp. TaxID=2127056 RepID=UPI002FDDF734